MSKFIESTHPLYGKHAHQWERCADAFEGGDAVKEKGEVYLPKLPGQDPDEYAAYKLRAVWYGASRRTLDLFTGLVFAKATKYEGAKPDDPLMQDADLAGTTFDDIAEETLEEVLGLGRFGILVDFSGEIQPGASLGDAERSGARPFVACYYAADILNWHTSSIGGRKTLDHLCLRESYEDAEGKIADQHRELVLESMIVGEKAVLGYRSEVWRKVKNSETGKEEWVTIPDLQTIPLMGGKPLDSIPFFFFGPEGGRPDPSEPPLLDLVDVNYSHYRTEADLEHALYHCGLPTPTAVGVPEDFVFALGGRNGLVATNPDAKFTYLEYSGSGVEPLEKRLTQKEAWMAKLGSDRLADDKLAAETATTAAIRKSGEAATLASMVQAVSGQLSKVLALLVSWAGGNGDGVSVQLNTEFLPATVTPQELTVLLQAVQSADLRRVDFLRRLQIGGIIAQDVDVEEIDKDLGDNTSGTLGSGLLALAEQKRQAEADAAAAAAAAKGGNA